MIIKYKKILIGLGILGVAYGAGVTLLPNDIALTEVPVVQTQTGEQYWNIFKDNTTGDEIKIETTKEEYFYNTIGTGKRPTYPNAKLVAAYGGTPIYTESIPTLKDYEFFIEDKSVATSSSNILIKLPNQDVKEVSGTYVIDGKLSSAELDLLK
jgi:hypothetical protein